MKYSLVFLLAMLAISCGKVTITAGENMEGDTVLDPIAADVAGLTELCDALNDKHQKYRIKFLNQLAKFNFTTQRTNCDGVKGATETGAFSIVEGSNASLEFRPNAVMNYYFRQIETQSSGILSNVCSRLGETMQPYKLSEQTAVYAYVADAAPGCTGKAQTKCVQVKTLFKQASGNYSVSIIDTFRISFKTGDEYGLELMHTRQDKDFCSAGKSVTLTQNFVSITP